MKKIAFLSALLAASTLTFTSCKPEGIGGDGEVHFDVAHHGELVPGATVYIKYGAKESPGTDPSSYDDFVVTDAEAHGDFAGLNPGNYYLYAVGFDSSISQAVDGGLPVKVDRDHSHEVEIPVTED